MAEATPAAAVPNARLSGSKRKKVPGSSSHSWDSYLHQVLQDSHPGVKITKEAMQVWAEALDAWLQQLVCSHGQVNDNAGFASCTSKKQHMPSSSDNTCQAAFECLVFSEHQLHT